MTVTSSLIEAHVQDVERITMDVCRNVPRCVDVNEIYGAGYLALCKAAESFDATRGATFMTWAYRPIRQAVTAEAWWIVNWRWWILGQWRSPQLTDWEDENDSTEDPKAQRSEFFYDLARGYVRDRLEEIDEPDRMVLKLSFLDGCLHEDIAARLGKSITSISLYKRRGLKALSSKLTDEETELTALLESRSRRVVPDMARYLAQKRNGRANGKLAYVRMNEARLAKRCT